MNPNRANGVPTGSKRGGIKVRGNFTVRSAQLLEAKLAPLIPLDVSAASSSVQMAMQLRRHIAAGTLRAGEQLPAPAELARQTGLTHRKWKRCYQRLQAEGVLSARKGKGVYVAADARARCVVACKAVAAEAQQRLFSVFQQAYAFGLSRQDILLVLDAGFAEAGVSGARSHTQTP